jgi:hypothetical protein
MASLDTIKYAEGNADVATNGVQKMKRLAQVAIALLLIVPAALSPAGAKEVRQFAGAASQELVLDPVNFTNQTSFDVEKPGTPLTATMNVKTVAGAPVTAPKVDVGGDGTPDWRFEGTAFGDFGRQNLFANGRPDVAQQIAGPSVLSTAVKLPKTATISDVSMDVVGTPNSGSVSMSQNDQTIAASGQGLYSIAGIPQEAVGLNASVQVTSAQKNVVDQEQPQSSTSQTQFVGYSQSLSQWQSVAQTFKPNMDGELTRVQVFIANMSGNPNTLFMDIRTTDVQEIPTTTIIASTSIAVNKIINTNWNSFNFSNIFLKSGTAYAIILYAKNADTGQDSGYKWSVIQTNPYTRGAEWKYSDPDGTGTPSQTNINNYDMSFKTFMKLNLSTSEMLNFKVNLKAPTGPDANGAYYYNFSTPAYPGQTWPCNIANQNTGFDVIGLNFTATTYYNQYVRDVAIDVAADNITDRPISGRLDGTTTVNDIKSVFGAALLLQCITAVNDAYGNPMCTLPINFHAQGYGNLSVRALRIDYTYTAAVPNFTAAIGAYLVGKPDGTVSVPVVVSGASTGKLLLDGLLVSMDYAPSLDKNIENFVIMEETENLNLTDVAGYFSDDDGGPITYAVASNSNSTRVDVTLNGTVLGARALAVNWTGQTDVVVSATDARGQTTLSNAFSIIVRDVNDAPVITSAPPEKAEALRPLVYQVEVYDSEGDVLAYKLNDALAGMSLNSTGVFNWTPPKSLINQRVNVTVNVSDGKLWVVQKFALLVFTNNTSPVITPTFVTTAYAGRPYACQVQAHDDNGDRLTYSLDSPPAGMSINSTSGLISWPNPLSSANITVNVTDGFNSTTMTYFLTVVRNTPPKITSTAPEKIVWGELLSYQVTVDNPEPSQTVAITLVNPPDGMAISPGGLVTWKPKESQKGSHHVRIQVSDGFDTANQSFDIEVTEKPIIPGTDNTLLYILLIVIMVAAAAAGGYYLNRWYQKKKLMEQRWPEMPKKPDGPSPTIKPLPPEKPGVSAVQQAVSWTPAEAAAAPAAAPAAAVTPAVPPPPPGAPIESRVQDIFIIYRDGRLIHHLTNRLTAMDHEIFASMFSSVQDFMKDSMGADRIDSIKYEEYNILLEKGKNISLAVVLSGDEPADIRQVIKTAISDVELVCSRLLEKWDGDSAPLKKDLELLLKPISEAVAVAKVDKKPKTKNPEEYVSILSGVEFFRGYVKVKFAVSNDLDNVITDANVKIIVKQDSLRIGWVEPADHALQGDNIHIGNVQPGEKVQFNLFLDPLVCSASFVDATLAFKDAKGDLYSIVMSRRKADVVCPTFHTDQDINVAMLRKMITEFAHHDTKVYTLPEGLWAEEAFKMGMSVIEGHNVKLVREFTETAPVYAAEGWYYGKTQIKKDEVVMRISVSREHNSLEFFVGSSDQAVIAGLLAEFGHELNRRLKNKGLIQKDIKHLDLTDKDRVARKSQLLLHRYAEAEAGVAENEPKK